MSLFAGVKELAQYRELLWVWSVRELKARYKQSIFGFAWAIFQPIALTMAFVVAFSYFIKIPSDGIPYPIFSYSAMLPWTFFVRGLSLGIPSIVQNMSLVNKIYVPRMIFPLAAILTSFVDYLCGLVVFLGMMVFYRVELTPAMAFVPILFLIQLILMIGLTLGGAALNVYFRDISQMVPILLQLWMYASPIIYPLSQVPEWLRPYYMLNPMAVVLNGYRQTLFFNQLPDASYIGLAFAVSLLALFLGYFVFKKIEARFADII